MRLGTQPATLHSFAARREPRRPMPEPLLLPLSNNLPWSGRVSRRELGRGDNEHATAEMQNPPTRCICTAKPKRI